MKLNLVYIHCILLVYYVHYVYNVYDVYYCILLVRTPIPICLTAWFDSIRGSPPLCNRLVHDLSRLSFPCRLLLLPLALRQLLDGLLLHALHITYCLLPTEYEYSYPDLSLFYLLFPSPSQSETQPLTSDTKRSVRFRAEMVTGDPREKKSSYPPKAPKAHKHESYQFSPQAQ